MKLTDYAKKRGVTYRTAWNWYHRGLIENAYQERTGTIIVNEDITHKKEKYVVIYARVSSSENKSNLDTQTERLTNYAIAKGHNINEVVKEVGSGVNDNRKKLQKILKEGKATLIIVEHKDRLTRFGYNYINTLSKHIGCEIDIVNKTDNCKDDLMQDLVSIITSFCARYYGLRRSKRKTEQIINVIKNDTK